MLPDPRENKSHGQTTAWGYCMEAGEGSLAQKHANYLRHERHLIEIPRQRTIFSGGHLRLWMQVADRFVKGVQGFSGVAAAQTQWQNSVIDLIHQKDPGDFFVWSSVAILDS